VTFVGPRLFIEHQKTFTIRLGHTDHTIGTKQDWAGGRADILVKSGGKPLAVVELKAPGESLDTGVAGQALSYARLTEPMAPLAIVTNGQDTRVSRSFDGQELDTKTFDAAAVAERFNDAGRLAEATYDAAVRELLARMTRSLRSS
jgi:type I site-specific restriction endonuclease